MLSEQAKFFLQILGRRLALHIKDRYEATHYAPAPEGMMLFLFTRLLISFSCPLAQLGFRLPPVICWTVVWYFAHTSSLGETNKHTKQSAWGFTYGQRK